MPVDGLSQFINYAIPIGLVVAFFGFIWWKFQEPFKALFGWLKETFASGKTKTVEKTQQIMGKEIYYDI